MSNITIIPESFKNQRAFNLIELDDFSGVIFRQRQEHLKKEVYTTCHIFVVVLCGEKVIHTPEGDFHIKAGNAFLARRGLHLFSEVFAGENMYESLIFLLMIYCSKTSSEAILLISRDLSKENIIRTYFKFQFLL